MPVLGSSERVVGRRRALRRRTNGEQVAAFIRRLIISGELRPGERILQEDIAAELGLSRIPVREGLLILDGEGWVRFESNDGTYVSGLTEADVRDHYELRGLVFGAIASYATTAAGPEDLAELSLAHRSMREAETVAAFAAANDDFVRKLVALAASPRLSAAIRLTASIIADDFFEVVPARAIQERGTAAV